MENQILGASAPAEGLSCSFFASALDNQPRPWRGTWEILAQSFRRDRQPSLHSPELDSKKFLPAISGATYAPGNTRCRASVLSLHLAVFDVDNAEERPDPSGAIHPSGRPMMVKLPVAAPTTLDLVCNELERLGIAGYCWSTWSSTAEWPRFRVVLPLAQTVDPEVWGQATEWLIAVTGLNRWRGCLDLPVLRDTARIHFLPARRPGAPPVHRREVKGEILMPPARGALAKIAPPKPSILSWQEDARTARNDSFCSTTKAGKRSWARRFRGSNGQALDLATLNGVRLLEALGCKVGPGQPWNNGTKHRTTCPWPDEHTHGLNDDSGVLFLEPGRWPAWHCAHSHHAHLGLVDLLEAAGCLR